MDRGVTRAGRGQRDRAALSSSSSSYTRSECPPNHRPVERRFNQTGVPAAPIDGPVPAAAARPRPTRSANALGSPGGTSQPVTPCSTLSGKPPARLATDRTTMRHGLERDERAAFVDRRMDEQVGGLVPRVEVAVFESAEPLNAATRGPLAGSPARSCAETVPCRRSPIASRLVRANAPVRPRDDGSPCCAPAGPHSGSTI